MIRCKCDKCDNNQCSCFTDHASERIKLNVNYDQKLGVTTTTTGTDGEIDSLTSLWHA